MVSEAVEDLRARVAGAERRVFRATYAPEWRQRDPDPEDALAFPCELRAVGRRELDAYGKKSTKREFDRKAKTWIDRPDEKEYRAFCASCITGWDGLTLGLYFRLSPYAAPESLNGDEARPIRFTGDQALVLCETITGFEDWVFQQVTTVANQLEAKAADVKNG